MAPEEAPEAAAKGFDVAAPAADEPKKNGSHLVQGRVVEAVDHLLEILKPGEGKELVSKEGSGGSGGAARG